jgi:hypothetical protein
MPPEVQQLVNEIATIKQKLDQSHDTDRDYLPPLLRELRTYIFQVHANYETSMEIIIWKDYLKSSKNFWDFDALFERMTFEDKRRLVRSMHSDFPNRLTVKLNDLRNVFAHRKGEAVRNGYNDDAKRLEAYKLLEEAHDSLNDFFARRAGIEQQ